MVKLPVCAGRVPRVCQQCLSAHSAHSSSDLLRIRRDENPRGKRCLACSPKSVHNHRLTRDLRHHLSREAGGSHPGGAARDEISRR